MTPLTDLARSAHRAKGGAGLVLARQHDGQVEVAAAGPVDPGAVFELGSITKVVTGLLLADAAVRGEVTLDTPLAECLPGATARGPAITLGELATHTAGLPRVPLALLRRVGPFARTDPYAATSTEELVADLARVRRRARGRPRYSNFGSALLGQALAARAGTSYASLVEDRVLGPFALDELWIAGGPAPAQPHDRRGRPVPPWRLGAYAPAGALHGTVRGALGLSAACLRPPPELRAVVDLALTPRAGRGPVVHGLGWVRSPVSRDAVVWWHDGGTHGSRAFTGFDPRAGIAVAAVTNGASAPDAAARRAFAS